GSFFSHLTRTKKNLNLLSPLRLSPSRRPAVFASICPSPPYPHCPAVPALPRHTCAALPSVTGAFPARSAARKDAVTVTVLGTMAATRSVFSRVFFLRIFRVSPSRVARPPHRTPVSLSRAPTATRDFPWSAASAS
ncbi:hypothetical protein BRADI_1g28105v3, partial [Brachypodium distachyon]